MKCNILSVLKTTSPLHIADSGDARLAIAKGRISYTATAEASVPCTCVQKMTVVSPLSTLSSESEGDTEKSNVVRDQVPVIAGNNIAGRLRRQAGLLVLKALEAKGEKVSLSSFSVLMCGAVTGKPDGENLTYAEYVEAKKHPYFGLFGGGPKMIRRNVRVSTALPMITLLGKGQAGMLRHPLETDLAMTLKPRELTGAWTFRRNDDLKDLSKISAAESSVENFVEEFEKKQELLLADKTKKDDGDKGERSSTQTFSAIEFVFPGIFFEMSFELDIDNAAQLGLFLLCLDNLAANERLGGWSRNGFGQFVIEQMMLEVVEGDQVFGEETTVQLFNEGRLNRDNAVVAEALTAWSDAAKNLSAKEIDSQYGTAKDQKEKKVKAAKTK